MANKTLYIANGTISAQNTFFPDNAASPNGVQFMAQAWFAISIEGTFVGTVFLQKSYDSGLTWYDQTSWTAATESVCYNADGGAIWRIGIKTGGYGSGNAIVRISQ